MEMTLLMPMDQWVLSALQIYDGLHLSCTAGLLSSKGDKELSDSGRNLLQAWVLECYAQNAV